MNGNPFHNFTNEEVKDIMNRMDHFDPDLHRWAMYQVFIVNKTPRSVDPQSRSCLYSPRFNGVGCAIGLIVPSELQDKLIETCPIEYSVSTVPEINQFFSDANPHMLNELQIVHDDILETNPELAGRLFLGNLTFEDVDQYEREAWISNFFLDGVLINNPVKQYVIEEPLDEQTQFVQLDASNKKRSMITIFTYLIVLAIYSGIIIGGIEMAQWIIRTFLMGE